MKKIRNRPAVIIKEQNTEALYELMKSEYLRGVDFAITKVLDYLEDFPNHSKGEVKQSLKTMREVAGHLEYPSKK